MATEGVTLSGIPRAGGGLYADDAPFVLRYEQETIQKFITYTFSFYLTLSISLKKS